MSRKLSKTQYLIRKKLKDDARRRESEHVVDYSECPVRDEPVKSNRRSFDDGFMTTMLMMSMMRSRSSKTREMAIMKKELEDE